MHIQTEPLLGFAFAFGTNGETVQVAQLNKAELATLGKAADILEKLRTCWHEDDDRTPHLDIAVAGMTIRELVEDKGRVEL